MGTSDAPGAQPGAGDGVPSARAARRRRAWVAGSAVAVAALLVALALLLRETPGATLAQAVDATVAEGTSLVTVTGTARDVPLIGDVTLSVAEGELDLGAERAQLRRELPLLSGRDLPLVGEIGDVELLYADGGAWLRSPLATERSWVRLRDAQDDAAATAPGLGNPLALLALVRAVDGEPVEEERESVDGVPATRYRVTIDLEALDGEVGAGSRSLLDRLRSLHEEGRLPLDIWVDDDLLIRRIRYELDTDLPGLPALRLGTEAALDGHGTEVAISPPGDDEVIEWSAERLRDLSIVRLLREWVEELPFIGD